MLSELLKSIEKSLASYVKQRIPSDQTVFLEGGVEGMVTQATSLTATRRQDILAIHQLCETARLNQSSPRACIESVFRYVQQMKTGFFIFTGDSKLRDCVIQGIEHYDTRYIQWKRGKAHLVEDIESIPATPDFMANRPDHRVPFLPELHPEEYSAQAALSEQVDRLTRRIVAQDQEHQLRLAAQAKQHEKQLSQLMEMLQKTEANMALLHSQNVRLMSELFKLKNPHSEAKEADRPTVSHDGAEGEQRPQQNTVVNESTVRFEY